MALERARMRPVPSERRSDGECHCVDHFKPCMQPLSEASRVQCLAPRDQMPKASRWKVYPGFIPDGDRIICKTYMTRVEGENTRFRHTCG